MKTNITSKTLDPGSVLYERLKREMKIAQQQACDLNITNAQREYAELMFVRAGTAIQLLKTGVTEHNVWKYFQTGEI